MPMEAALRIAGTVTGLLGGFVSALWEIFLSPLRAGGTLLWLSPVLAVVGNLTLVWYTCQVTGRRGLALLPGIGWFLTMVVAMNKTAEGDLPITGNDWPGIVALLAGALGFGIAAYRVVAPPARP